MFRYYLVDPAEFTIDQWFVLWEGVGYYESMTRAKSKAEFVSEIAKMELEKQKRLRDINDALKDVDKALVDIWSEALKGSSK